jgi:Bacteriocin-protection, YdeI or OmpD-Associated/Domain of unknown function (DUF1905)
MTSKSKSKAARPLNLAKLQETKSTIRFSAKLFRPAPKATEKPTEKIGGIGSWTLLTLPKNASAGLPSPPPSRDVTMVEGTINGFPFRAALGPNGDGSHWLRLSKALQDAAGISGSGGGDVGDTVTLEITRVGEEPECRVPMDLRKALESARPSYPGAQALSALWGVITPMARRDWILWIVSAKQEETRRRRIENACDMLASGKRRPCCMPGINWRRKDSDVTSDGTWLPLPNSKSRPFGEIDKVEK